MLWVTANLCEMLILGFYRYLMNMAMWRNPSWWWLLAQGEGIISPDLAILQGKLPLHWVLPLIDTLPRAPEAQSDSKSITPVDSEASSVTSTTCMESRFVGLLFYHLSFGPPFSGEKQFLSNCICKGIYFTSSRISKLWNYACIFILIWMMILHDTDFSALNMINNIRNRCKIMPRQLHIRSKIVNFSHPPYCNEGSPPLSPPSTQNMEAAMTVETSKVRTTYSKCSFKDDCYRYMYAASFE